MGGTSENGERRSRDVRPHVIVPALQTMISQQCPVGLVVQSLLRLPGGVNGLTYIKVAGDGSDGVKYSTLTGFEP